MPKEARWLSDYEQKVWRAYIAMSQLLFTQLSLELQREHGMGVPAYGILVRLSEAPSRTLRMSELADSELSSRSRISHAVARLEELGWVERSSCPTDKRGSFATLTDLGFSVLENAAPDHVEGVRTHLFDALTEKQTQQLYEIADTVASRLRTLDRPECRE